MPQGKESTCIAGDTGDVGSTPELGRSLCRGKWHPPQYPCLENPMDRGAWWATVHGVAKSRAQLSIHSSLRSSLYFLIPTSVLSSPHPSPHW